MNYSGFHVHHLGLFNVSWNLRFLFVRGIGLKFVERVYWQKVGSCHCVSSYIWSSIGGSSLSGYSKLAYHLQASLLEFEHFPPFVCILYVWYHKRCIQLFQRICIKETKGSPNESHYAFFRRHVFFKWLIPYQWPRPSPSLRRHAQVHLFQSL